MFKKILFYFLISTTVFAQKQVQTSIDTTKNKIGAEFKLTFKTLVDTASKVVFPNLKNFGSLEVIQSYPIDTVLKDDRYELVKKYGLTQFDSGRYTIPSVKILINNKAVFSDSIKVEVANVQVDTLKQKMYDIKDIVAVEDTIGDWWKYLLGLVLLAGIGAGIYWYFKKHQKQKVEEEVYKTPIEKATSLLNNLEKKELWQHGEVKEYYSELTDIVRNYIEEAIEIPAMESTTSELIEGLKLASNKKKMKLTKDTFDNLLGVLRQADLVKFAKSKPLEFEITEDRKKIERAIITLDKAIPKVIEVDDEMLLNEMQRQEQLKRELQKQKKKRITTIGVSVFLVLFAVTTFFVVTRGFDYVIDNVFGNSSKELLEGEWVKSEYGSPSIRISTPKVLVRTDLTKVMPKDGAALIKDMQSFTYGSFEDNFYIMLSTLHFKQETKIDLAKSLEGALQALEAQGAQNMIVKQEDFETNEGAVKGVKGYGTFSKLNVASQSSTKYYYETLIFSQDGGLQQIIIVHEEGDKYANEISDKILDSVELQNAQQ
jgi:flagellar basal body-associated protein FliL